MPDVSRFGRLAWLWLALLVFVLDQGSKQVVLHLLQVLAQLDGRQVARVLAGDAGLAADVEAVRRAVLAAKAGGASVLADVAAMRGRLQAAKPAAGSWEAKNGAGRLMDIELLAQTAALRAADPARQVGLFEQGVGGQHAFAQRPPFFGNMGFGAGGDDQAAGAQAITPVAQATVDPALLLQGQQHARHRGLG